MEQQIIAVVREALQAEKLVRVGGSGGAPFQFLRVPDHRLRLRAARFVAAYSEGLPVAALSAHIITHDCSSRT